MDGDRRQPEKQYKCYPNPEHTQRSSSQSVTTSMEGILGNIPQTINQSQKYIELGPNHSNITTIERVDTTSEGESIKKC